jgi:hypothetical protein
MTSEDSWTVSLHVMLGSLNHGEVQACSISRIPDDLRKSNEDAYKPKLISIGPLHRGSTRQMLLMEETKWRYMHDFLSRNVSRRKAQIAEQRLEDCGKEILKLDKIVRSSYGGDIQSEPQDLAKIMMVDGCFLLDLLLKLGEFMDTQLDQRNPQRRNI